MYSDNVSNDRWGATTSKGPQRYSREVNELDYIVPRGAYYFEHDDRDVWKPSRGRLQNREAGSGGHHLTSRNIDTGFSPHSQPGPPQNGSRAPRSRPGPSWEEGGERRSSRDAGRPPISSRLGSRQRARSASRERSPPPRRPREESRQEQDADRHHRNDRRMHDGDRRHREEDHAQEADMTHGKPPQRLRSTVHSALAGQERAAAYAEDGAAPHSQQQRGEPAGSSAEGARGSRSAGAPPKAGEEVQDGGRDAPRRERQGGRLPSQVLGRSAVSGPSMPTPQQAQQDGGRWQQQQEGGAAARARTLHAGIAESSRFAGRLGQQRSEGGSDPPGQNSQSRGRPRGGMRSDHDSKWGHDLFEEAAEVPLKEPDLLQRTLLF